MRQALLLAAATALGGCDLSMTEQAKHQPQSSPTWWSGGPEVTPAPEGTVAADAPARLAAEQQPPAVTPALLRRGRERYTIYCAPCHGAAGGGDGIIVRRGFPRPPAFYAPAAAAIGPAREVDIIANGYGVMYGFAERVEPADRWAVAAYVEALKRAHAETNR